MRRLASSSQSLASQLIESEKLALKTIEYQRSIEGFTEKIVDQEKRHRDAFEELREWIKSDVISTITDDFMAFHSVLYKNSQMMGTTLFYIGASVATFLITCSTRAHSARFPMLLILLLYSGVEFWYLENAFQREIGRKGASATLLTILLSHMLRYRDLNSVNNKLLTQMSEKMSHLEETVATLQERVSEKQTDLDKDYIPYQIEYRPGFDDHDIFKPEDSDTYSYSGASDVSVTELMELKSSCEMVYSPRADYYRNIAKF